MDDLISRLSKIRSEYNCFSADEEPYYRALSEVIRILSQLADGDTISRQAAIDCVTYDVEHTIECLKALPSVASSTAHTTETTAETTAPSTDDWVPVKKRLPAVPCCRCLITRDDGRGRVTVEEALFSFSRWCDNKYLEDGRNRKFDISASVIAWAPFPAPYRGGDT